MDCIKIFSKGWNYSQDGRGNRLLYHFQGCNLSCPWCSNPEGIAIEGTMLVYSDKLLDTVCPYGAVQNKTLDRNRCRICIGRQCLSKNRNKGIAWSAKEYDIDTLIEEIEKSKPLFSGKGGITLTGGEPTLQFKPLKTLLARCKAIQVPTAIETNGTCARLPELFEFVDTMIIDFKHYDSETHQNRLGLGNDTVIENLWKTAESGIELWIRIPVIPGFNDSPDDIRQFISIIALFKQDNLSVELLP
ncbi:MAG: glycyl-radical enzyme activating protein, partial [Tannerella sp.]|nr:glycyl-radical enzyme activating protein [Tannerella sp.]